jgi:hypothetical protein
MQERLKLYCKDREVGEIVKDLSGCTLTLHEGAPVEQVPFHFRLEYENGQHVFGTKEVEAWIDHRSIPRERQDLADILRRLGLDKYDQWEMFKLYKGRCAMDSFSVSVLPH